MRLLATVLTVAAVALLLAGQTSAASAKQERCTSTKQGIEYYRIKTWNWQERLVMPKTRASLKGAQLAQHPGCGYLRWVAKLWQNRAEKLKTRFERLNGSIYGMSTTELYEVTEYEIAHGGIYSSRWGDASERLKEACYELVERAFAPYGASSWARYVVNRESGCNPGAVNSSSSTTGIAQFDPYSHRWVDYNRLKRDMRYAIWTFLRLSKNGSNTQPWCLSCY